MTTDQKPPELEPAPFKCAVCDEPARGFHFGAFTCEGCKSFFGRTTMKKASEKFECKNNGQCDVKGSNRTSCKFCRFRTCLDVGMSPTNSRFGRRSKYFKISIASKISNKVLINPVSPLTQSHSDSRANMQIPHNISSIYPLYSIILNRFLQFYGFPQNLKKEKM